MFERARVPGIPRLRARGDATVWHDFTAGREHFTWNLAAGVTRVGRRSLAADQLGTGFTTVDLGGSMRWRWIEAGVAVENLLDARYHEVELLYDSDFSDPAGEATNPMTHFAAGAPLSAMGTLSLHF